jgi:hypothetical protein
MREKSPEREPVDVMNKTFNRFEFLVCDVPFFRDHQSVCVCFRGGGWQPRQCFSVGLLMCQSLRGGDEGGRVDMTGDFHLICKTFQEAKEHEKRIHSDLSPTSLTL